MTPSPAPAHVAHPDAAEPDVSAMLAFQRGDEVAFDQLYGRWRAPILTLAHRMLGRGGQAEEVTQEVFVRLYRARDRYRPTAAFRTYLLRIATNLCLNERRRASFRREEGGLDGGLELIRTQEPGPDQTVAGAALGLAVEAALRNLPERQRAAVVLARYEGCSMAEMAEVLQITEGAAKVLLHRARAQLKDALAPWLGEDP